MDRSDTHGDCVVVGMFDRAEDAAEVMRELQDRGFRASSTAVDQGRDSEPEVRSDLVHRLRKIVTGRATHRFAEGVRRGGTLVDATVATLLVDEAIQIMERHGAVDIDERCEAWRAQGWIEPQEPGELHAQRGRVRVYGASGADDEVRQRRDESYPSVAGEASSPFTASFEEHFQTRYAPSGGRWDEYDAAYRWGHTLANEEQWRGRAWSEVEGHAHQVWEGRRPGTWERFKEAIRYGWDRMTARATAQQR